VSAVYLQQFPSYSNHNCKKNRHFYVPSPLFFLPWECPCGNHAKRCMNEKPIQCLPNPSQHVPIYLEQFPSYSNRKCKKIAVFTYRSPHFCFPWRRPCDYHAICCMDGKTIQCLSNILQHVPIYLQQFPSYSNRMCKKSPFSRTAAHISVSPGYAPAIITQYVARMERQFNACQTPRSMYLSIFNSFRVIRCLNQCVRPKIAIFFTTFWFPLGTPLGQSR